MDANLVFCWRFSFGFFSFSMQKHKFECLHARSRAFDSLTATNCECESREKSTFCGNPRNKIMKRCRPFVTAFVNRTSYKLASWPFHRSPDETEKINHLFADGGTIGNCACVCVPKCVQLRNRFGSQSHFFFAVRIG